MKNKLPLCCLLVSILFACSENSETSGLQDTVDSLKTTISSQENELDSIKWKSTILLKVNKGYEDLLSKEGIYASYSIQKDSSVTIELIEDKENELESE